ncbi:hypothetical protein [Duganella sp. S19_KUP01_CR8]|uniref:hypothetical protein n=1 Tax=Duganella sp. S19_KUP01_CR8 TaxID=3025502 RepID=UPI002FCDCCE1
MKRTLSVQLPSHTLLDMIEQAGLNGESQDPSVIVLAAVELWLAAQQKRAPAAAPAAVHGYQWKSLFLPEGTLVRCISYGDHHYASVEGDAIVYEGRKLSPNQFAALHANSVRNAWNDLYIRRPGDKFYKIARQLRREQAAADKDAHPQPEAALLPAVPTRAEPAPCPPAPATPPRDTSPGVGWTLPERRKFRLRLEDVAFD